MSQTKSKSTKGIPQEEWEAAAMYFTVSNLALLHLARGNKNLHVLYAEANQVMLCEVGCSINLEYRDWYQEVKGAKAKDYVTQEWNKVRSSWEWC